MAEFFDDEPGREIQIVRKGKGRRIAGTEGNVIAEVLAQRGGNGGLNAIFLEVGAGELRVAPKPHASDEYFLYVLRGACELLVENDAYSLEAGDSVYVNARREQWIKNVGTGSFQALLISQSALIGSEIQTLLAQANA